jgi:tRNA G18 (ribose-2'-O)-methylase SpoU
MCKALTVYLADMQGDTLYWDADFRGPTGLLIGGEAHGVSEQAKKLASRTIYLPMPGDAESLNAAVAGSVIAFEVLRQRGIRRGR